MDGDGSLDEGNISKMQMIGISVGRAIPMTLPNKPLKLSVGRGRPPAA
jgi:hypothetical protein